jgi:hypothetical protein
MKRILLACMLLIGSMTYSQTTYYWVGSSTATPNISTNSNWNTMLNGTGSSRGSSTGSGDILVFDGTNLGGATPVTGPVTININTSITCAALRFINGADVSMGRTTSGGGGTSTISLNGEGTSAPDFFIDATSTATVVSGNGSSRISPVAGVTTISGLVNGNFRMITSQQMRFDNGIAGTGKLVFANGSSFTSNITGASSYPFGSGTQSAEKWTVFEAGSHLYYDGGNSVMASSPVFSPIDFKPGSFYHHRSNNGAGGTFFNRKSFADVIVENNATLTIDGPVYRIDNLTIAAGSSFVTSATTQTAVLGNVVVNGNLTSPAGSSHELLFAGNNPQTISGSGTLAVASLFIASNASVTLSKDITVDNATTVYGKINFGTNRITGAGTFIAYSTLSTGNAIGNLTAGLSHIAGTGIAASQKGLVISGAGIAANTSIVGFSSTGDSIYLSSPITASGTGVALTLSGKASVLQTANTNGFDPVTGSVGVAGVQTFNDGINYIINGATTQPFGITSAGTGTPITMEFLEVTAPITLNRSFTVSDHLTVNGKITLRLLDVAHILSTAALNGTFNTNNYIATSHSAATGEVSHVRVDGVNAAALIPVGSASNYLPVTLTPSSASDFTVAVFEGITTNGLVNGTALTPVQKQRVVDAVWNINRLAGTGNVATQFSWSNVIEGSTFTTLPDGDIGIITNTGSSWSAPSGTGNNTTNTAAGSFATVGSFAIGAVPPSTPFVFNPLPVKTYGDPDFNGGASSLNTTQPIVYSSDNTAVATIVGGLIHIVGAGSANITASQASDGFYPAASVTQPLIVNKAALTITADNKTKFEQTANPTLTATYTGFVYSETPAVLLTPVVLTTTAVLASPPGTYPITASGATSNNYNITFVAGTLTVQPKTQQVLTFPAITTKTYGNANFASNVSSNNNTIPIILVSSNTNVATIVAGNQIHIVGAGISDITASQPGNDGYFAATPITRTLTVNKANLTIRVRDTSRVEQTPNPPFTLTYTGFVLGETVANLLTPPVATTTADINSSPGYYPITLSGATTNNYNITYTNGRLTVFPANNAQQTLNPYQSASNTLTVRVYSDEPRIADIIIYDLSGKPVMKKNLFMPKGFISTDMNIGLLASGVYIVKLKGAATDLSKMVRIIH